MKRHHSGRARVDNRPTDVRGPWPMETLPSHARPGARNMITDVPGLKVGQAQDVGARTGVTVILPDARAVCACDVRGGGPGARETHALAPENLVGAGGAGGLSRRAGVR